MLCYVTLLYLFLRTTVLVGLGTVLSECLNVLLGYYIIILYKSTRFENPLMFEDLFPLKPMLSQNKQRNKKRFKKYTLKIVFY